MVYEGKAEIYFNGHGEFELLNFSFFFFCFAPASLSLFKCFNLNFILYGSSSISKLKVFWQQTHTHTLANKQDVEEKDFMQKKNKQYNFISIIKK